MNYEHLTYIEFYLYVEAWGGWSISTDKKIFYVLCNEESTVITDTMVSNEVYFYPDGVNIPYLEID